MAPLSVTFSDLEGHFWNVSVSNNSRNTACIIYDTFTYKPESASGL